MKKAAWRIIQISLLLLTIAGMVKAVFVSLDIDESYAVSEAYRLISGDKLLYDMWEPHQFSALIPALFLFPFVKLAGSTAYSVIYLRIIGTLLHFAVGFFLYRTTKEEAGGKAAFLLTVFHLNFLSKWVAMPEFELIHYWCMLLIFLFLYRFEKTKKIHFAALAGVCYFFSGLSYPTMVFLLPVYLIGLLLSKKKAGAGGFVLGAGVPVVLLIGSILITIPVSRLKEFLGYVFMDSSHTGTSAAVKWSEYGRQFLSQGIKFGKSLLIAIAIIALLWGIMKLAKKRMMNPETAVFCGLFLVVTILSVRAMIGFVFGDENQFFFQVRYAVLALLFLVMALARRKERRSELWYGILPSVLSLPAILLITNMDTNTAYAKLMSAIIVGFFMLAKDGHVAAESADLRERTEKFDTHAYITFFTNLTAGALLICFFICRILLIRVTGCLPVSIKANLVQIQNGPAAGIFVTEEPGKYWNEAYAELKEAIPEDSNVLYIGAEQLFYVAFCRRVNTPSVQGTTVFNEMYGTYYEIFPEKKPEIIVTDETFGTNPAYFYAPENSYITDWIAKNLNVTKERSVGPYHILYAER